jgi:DNA-directed RNA polymerase specialized sigma24 family protein
VKAPISQSILAEVRHEVDALPTEERTVVMLVCAGGLSYQDVARKLSISPEEVKDRLLRGRLVLMKRLSSRIRFGDKPGRAGALPPVHSVDGRKPHGL